MEFDAALSAGKLERFVERLESLSLLETGVSPSDASSPTPEIHRERLRGSRLLYIKLKTLNPDRALSVVAPRLGFFFTRRFVWIAIGLSAVAVGIVASSWSDYAFQTKSLLTAGSIPAFLLVAFVVSGLHELAHAFTCKRFGGKVYELGVGVGVQIQPCLLDLSKYPNVRTSFCPLNNIDGGRTYFAIDPAGNFRMCNRSRVLLGNLREGRFNDIAWELERRGFPAGGIGLRIKPDKQATTNLTIDHVLESA